MLASWWLTWEVIWKLISLKKRTAVNVWHLQCGQQANMGQCCHTMTHHRRVGGLCPVNSGGHCSLCSQDPLHSQGEWEDQEEPHSQMGSSQIITKMGWKPRNRGDTRTHSTACWELHSENSDSARGTEHYKCQGHLTFNSVRGTEH